MWFCQPQTLIREKKNRHLYGPTVFQSSFSCFPRILRLQESRASSCHCWFRGNRCEGGGPHTVCWQKRKPHASAGSQGLGPPAWRGSGDTLQDGQSVFHLTLNFKGPTVSGAASPPCSKSVQWLPDCLLS